MSWLQSSSGEPAEVEKVLHAPIGAASPLWWAFAGAAGAGVAYWWLTHWAKPLNLEAAAAAPAVVDDPVLIEAAETYELIPEAIEDVVDTPAELETEAEAIVAAQAEIEALEGETVDDLTRLVGVGPKLAEALAERGVRTFAAIAAWGEAELARFDEELNLRGRAVRDAWVAQSKRLASPEPAPALPE